MPSSKNGAQLLPEKRFGEPNLFWTRPGNPTGRKKRSRFLLRRGIRWDRGVKNRIKNNVRKESPKAPQEVRFHFHRWCATQEGSSRRPNAGLPKLRLALRPPQTPGSLPKYFFYPPYPDQAGRAFPGMQPLWRGIRRSGEVPVELIPTRTVAVPKMRPANELRF
jgi:hypothetical protein